VKFYVTRFAVTVAVLLTGVWAVPSAQALGVVGIRAQPSLTFTTLPSIAK